MKPLVTCRSRVLEAHRVYLIGPLIGGIAAALVYDRFLAKAQAPA